ncbi:MAG: hypothetical protein VYA32_13115 [Planctomycetota bacterium]|nr:hypothetical protein [Planctomycetota bacterium]MED5399257.1 hypothetical protein [Planctomycetota bacterium]
MSLLKLYRPPQDTAGGDAPESPPVIYSIASFRLPARSPRRATVVARAQAIHANRVCRECGRSTVVPMEFQDASFSHNLMPIPGTATLAGFACHDCGASWALNQASVDG